MNRFIDGNKKLIVGFGSALVDMLTQEDDDFLNKTGAIKGGMKLVDYKSIENALLIAHNKPLIVPGGSACNTMIGIGKLGGTARFVGKRGKDELGILFESGLRDHNVEPDLFLSSSSPTGRVLSIITPDAERSMLTFLGASSESKPEEIINGCFDNAAIVHIEGYLMYDKELFLTALKAAKKSGAKISLDLASFTVVEGNKDFLDKIINEYIDILIANEDEARAFTGYSDELSAISYLSERTDIAVLKVGKRGSYIAANGKHLKISPKGSCKALDTTGAGDLWASGFLYGLVNGFSLDKCGELGSSCGYEVCQVIGAKISDEGWKRIKEILI